MPNWCENKLVVRGGKREMSKFKKVLNLDKDSKCNKIENLLKSFVPIPTDEELNWYNWCVENWGTKWDVTIYDEYIDDDFIELSFDTAWGPPVAWLRIVAKDHPKLKFSLKYDEPGMCFMGCAKGSNGEIVDESLNYWEK